MSLFTRIIQWLHPSLLRWGLRNEASVIKFRRSGRGVVACSGQTCVMANVTFGQHTYKDGIPLFVDYRQRAAATNTIPSTYDRDDPFTQDFEILGARAIDRSLRPNFPTGFLRETQVSVTVLSSDGVNDPLPLGINAASAAITRLFPEWHGPLGAVRVVCENDEWKTSEVVHGQAELELMVVSQGPGKIVMLEGHGMEMSEGMLEKALRRGTSAAEEILKEHARFIQENPLSSAEFAQRTSLARVHSPRLPLRIAFENIYASAYEMVSTPNVTKDERRIAQTTFWYNSAKAVNGLLGKRASQSMVHRAIYRVLVMAVKDHALGRETVEMTKKGEFITRPSESGKKTRPDGRGVDELRTNTFDLALLPIVHGSGLHTRGNTQVLATATLFPFDNRRRIINEATGRPLFKNFMLHYRFPAYSIGRVGKDLTDRRMIGHGNLAESALLAVIPDPEEIACSVRVNCEVTASDGSTSMTSVSAASMALMDAGVPIKRPVAGVSIGIHVDEHDESTYSLLTDILGMEDHFGEMDFKVAGTELGVTALQLDIKRPYVTTNMVLEALDKARSARLEVIDIMKDTRKLPRETMRNTPVCDAIHLSSNKSREFGQRLQELEDTSSATLRMSLDKSMLFVFAPNREELERIKRFAKEKT